ncbi:hypothetical protein CFOL_v3_26235 [Cephalotus follicularis]|uniref:Uncharacterized protein n=1 Tax=Cephalotus follicularis TaxID=3775 RepID=A0A1Q3CRB8_CEPFO|nr:hypothetical protein CFOL_v3_26235 [Cephalotus follicularis]
MIAIEEMASMDVLCPLGFMLLALIWKFDFPPFMVLIIAILNDGLFFVLLPETPALVLCVAVL